VDCLARLGAVKTPRCRRRPTSEAGQGWLGPASRADGLDRASASPVVGDYRRPARTLDLLLGGHAGGNDV
jgi:hypothetical protein